MSVSKLFKKVGLLANRNRTALRALQELGYPQASIRKALLDLNGIRLKDLAGISFVTLSHVIHGKRAHRGAQKAIAAALGLTVKELFIL